MFVPSDRELGPSVVYRVTIESVYYLKNGRYVLAKLISSSRGVYRPSYHARDIRRIYSAAIIQVRNGNFYTALT